MRTEPDFRGDCAAELQALVLRQGAALEAKPGRTLRIDLHCHDRNSDVPDETLGRILGAPETWLTTQRLVEVLRGHGVDVITITNHNNARSCFELQDRGVDVLTGAEFSCTLPDYGVGLHVLAYGFDPAQEARLRVLRKDLYKFQEYAAREGIPTVLAHPLHFYSPGGRPPLRLMDTLGVLFERFEALNGQRDTWQNLLTAAWLEGLDEEAIEAMAKRAGLPVGAFSAHPYRKRLTGGSDCHMGLFAGTTGTLLRVPDYPGERKPSELALEALRAGRVAPYGGCCEEEKLSVAFLDYFCQAAMNFKDPGLLRMALHRGTAREKLWALGIANGLLELRRHKRTMQFLGLFHEALHGRRPGFLANLMASKPYRGLLRTVDGIAQARKAGPEAFLGEVRGALPALYRELAGILAGRVSGRLRELAAAGDWAAQPPAKWVEKFELPSQLRLLLDSPQDGRDAYAPAGGEDGAARPAKGPSLARLADGLPFPLLAAGVLAGAAFTGSHVLYSERPFLDAFSRALGRHRHPRRVLWLTDTLGDRNGVSQVLRQALEEIRRRDLPVDILACGGGLASGPHLRVVDPVAEFSLPNYPGQAFRVPDILEVQRIFREGGYDRILCSTEGPMGLTALYLKHAFRVPAHFYLHTDWLDYCRRSLDLGERMLDRVRRVLRAYYRNFDGLFVLNSEHREWFAGPAMGYPAERIRSTAHWVDGDFRPLASRRLDITGAGAGGPVLLYGGRLSAEKGVLELPAIHSGLRARWPGLRLVLAGTGPEEARLKAEMPDAVFLGWVERERLPEVYASADLLLLPSRFDTFGCVVLEALACGLPVLAYDCKGPRDLLADGQGGLLARDAGHMVALAGALLDDPARLAELRAAAVRRASTYRPGPILDRLLRDLGLGGGAPGAADPIPAGEDFDAPAARANPAPQMA